MKKELLCIQTHSKGVVKAGNTYTLISRQPHCNCMSIVDVGIKSLVSTFRCVKCGKTGNCNGIFWLGSVLFAEIGEVDELEQYKQKETIEFEINLN